MPPPPMRTIEMHNSTTGPGPGAELRGLCGDTHNRWLRPRPGSQTPGGLHGAATAPLQAAHWVPACTRAGSAGEQCPRPPKAEQVGLPGPGLRELEARLGGGGGRTRPAERWAGPCISGALPSPGPARLLRSSRGRGRRASTVHPRGESTFVSFSY